MDKYLLYFSNKYNGDWDKIYYALKTVERVDENIVNDLVKKFSEKSKKYITILDEDYPQMFHILKKPPFVIYYKGNLELIKQNVKLNITGNYETQYIDKYIELIKDLPNDCVIVSSYWQELDDKIVSFCITNKKKLILILPCGLSLDKFQILESYLDSNNILILSEYPDNCNVTRRTALAINRLAASLSNALIILASKDKFLNGLVNSFLNIGREIYCFPSDANDKENANDSLINDGAKLINNFDLPLSLYDDLGVDDFDEE